MSLISAYALETVTRTPRGSVQGDGTYPYSDATNTLKARVTDKRRREYSPTGVEVVYDRIFWIDPSETIAMGDRLTWGFIDHEVVDLRVGRFLDKTQSHKKVMTKIVGV